VSRKVWPDNEGLNPRDIPLIDPAYQQPKGIRVILLKGHNTLDCFLEYGGRQGASEEVGLGDEQVLVHDEGCAVWADKESYSFGAEVAVMIS
jgi:hypothetical protein